MPVPRSSPTEATQSRGVPSAPPQAWLKRTPSSTGNIATRVLRSIENTRGSRSYPGRMPAPKWYGAPRPPHTSRPAAGRELVRPPSPTEREPAVGRPLPVDEQVAVVAEGLPVPQPDPVPRALRQRLRRHHQGVHRHHIASHPLEGGGVALGRPDDHVRGHDAARGDGSPWLQRADPGV